MTAVLNISTELQFLRAIVWAHRRGLSKRLSDYHRGGQYRLKLTFELRQGHRERDYDGKKCGEVHGGYK